MHSQSPPLSQPQVSRTQASKYFWGLICETRAKHLLGYSTKFICRASAFPAVDFRKNLLKIWKKCYWNRRFDTTHNPALRAMANGQWSMVYCLVNGQWFIVSYDCQWSMVYCFIWLSMVNGQWFIVSYDSANKQNHHKSHRMQ